LTLMIFAMPFSGTPELNSNLFGISGLKPLNILALSVLVLWLVKGGELLTYRDTLRFRATMIYFAYLAIFSIEFFRSYIDYGMLVLRYSTDFHESSFSYLLSFWVKPLLVTGLFLYIINHIKSRESVEAVVDLLLLAIFLFALATLSLSVDSVFSGEHRNELRDAFSESFGFHYNTVGTILMLFVPLALSRAISRGWGWLIVFAAILLALLLSQSRGAILGAIGGMLIYLFLLRRIGISTIAILLLIAALGVWLAEPLLNLFSQGVESGDLSEISSGRVDSMWLPLLNELFENPVRLIVGFGLFGVIMSDSYVMVSNFYQATHAHNAYIDLLVDGGLIVFVPFLILLVYSLRQAMKWGKELQSTTYFGLISSVAVYLVSSISERQFFPRPDNMLLLPLIALLLVIVISEKNARRYNTA